MGLGYVGTSRRDMCVGAAIPSYRAKQLDKSHAFGPVFNHAPAVVGVRKNQNGGGGNSYKAGRSHKPTRPQRATMPIAADIAALRTCTYGVVGNPLCLHTIQGNEANKQELGHPFRTTRGEHSRASLRARQQRSAGEQAPKLTRVLRPPVSRRCLWLHTHIHTYIHPEYNVCHTCCSWRRVRFA